MIAAPESFAMHALCCREDVTEPSGRSICGTHSRLLTPDGLCPAALELADLVEARDADWKKAASTVTADAVLMDVVTDMVRLDEECGMRSWQFDPTVWSTTLAGELGHLADAVLEGTEAKDQVQAERDIRDDVVQLAAVAVHFARFLTERVDGADEVARLARAGGAS